MTTIQVNQGTTPQTQIIQVNVQQTNIQNNIYEAPKPQTPAPQPLAQDTYTPSQPTPAPAPAVELPATPDTPIGVIKKTVGGAIVGGSVTTLAAMGAKAAFTDAYHAPTAAGVGLGVALGVGIGMLNLETGDKNINAATKTIGAGLVGAGATGMATSVAKALFTDRLAAPSGQGVMLGAALGGGIALVNVDTDNAGINTAAKTVGGALIGASATGMAASVGKALFTDYIHAASTSNLLLGAALGGGIALANVETGDKNFDAIKNTVAGGLIGGSAVGIASSIVGTLATDRLTGFHPVAMGIGVALGAGIAILSAEE